ncbi:MAG: glycosyl hydrolase family 28-related protein, partial [Acidobacteriota bacterium]
MKSLTLPIVLALAFLASSSTAQTLNVTDFGAIPDDQFDDSAGIQATVNAAFSRGGGVVIFPEGKFILRDQINIVPAQGVGYDISLRGFKGSVIEVSVGQGKIAFYAGNLNTFAVEDLIFVGKESNAPDDFYDARNVIFSNYVEN